MSVSTSLMLTVTTFGLALLCGVVVLNQRLRHFGSWPRSRTSSASDGGSMPDTGGLSHSNLFGDFGSSGHESCCVSSDSGGGDCGGSGDGGGGGH